VTDDLGDFRSIRIEDEMRVSYLDYAMSVIVARALPDRLRSLPDIEVRLERRRDPLVEVEVEVPRLNVLMDVRQMHVRALPEVVAAAKVDVAEGLEVRDRARPHAGALRRGEAEKELGRVGDQVGTGDAGAHRHLLGKRGTALEPAAREAAAQARDLERMPVSRRPDRLHHVAEVEPSGRERAVPHDRERGEPGGVGADRCP
jgi:hypothetical protein